MTTTVRMKASQIYKDWHVIDAAGRPLGRVATEAATLLRGKHKPTYEPHLDDGDFVIIINASQVKVTGRKAEQNKYYTHSGYPGGLQTRSYAVQLEKFPERVLEQAVWGMLPQGPLAEAMMNHLKVYKGSNHPHQSQVVGSERARAARLAAAPAATRPPARLRPLTAVEVVTAKEAAPVAATPKPKPAKAKAEPVVAPEPVVAEAPAAEPVVEAAAAPKRPAARKKAEAAAPEAVAAEAPKPRAPRKKAEATAPEAAAEAPAAEATEAKKPARRRAAAKQEE
ncbi:MAG: 50S ribosomal protein L13 [Chloroflexi bacterium]|nr:50S ribosomal protein L13 [Chloroflexota bacterium]